MPTLTNPMKSDYQLLFDSCLIQPTKAAAVNSMSAKIAANRGRYMTVGTPLGIPWYVVGLIHAMESGLELHDAPPQRRPAHRAHDALAPPGGRRPASRRSPGRRARSTR